MAKEKETALANVNSKGVVLYDKLDEFQLFMPEMIEHATMMLDSLSMLSSINKMETIHVPSGGMDAWQLPAADGSRIAKSFDGIIVATFLGRKFWEKAYGSGGPAVPPDCSSIDGFNGSTFGPCGSCKYNRFIDTEAGKKKMCQEFIKIVFYMDDSTIPYAITCPVKSMENYQKYVNRLASGGRDSNGNRVPPQMPYQVVTNFSLEKAKAGGGADYVKIVFRQSGALTDEQGAAMRDLAFKLKPILERLNEASLGASEDSED